MLENLSSSTVLSQDKILQVIPDNSGGSVTAILVYAEDSSYYKEHLTPPDEMDPAEYDQEEEEDDEEEEEDDEEEEEEDDDDEEDQEDTEAEADFEGLRSKQEHVDSWVLVELPTGARVIKPIFSCWRHGLCIPPEDVRVEFFDCRRDLGPCDENLVQSADELEQMTKHGLAYKIRMKREQGTT